MPSIMDLNSNRIIDGFFVDVNTFFICKRQTALLLFMHKLVDNGIVPFNSHV